ncbi:MAG: GTPase Era [Breznakia sp.]
MIFKSGFVAIIGRPNAGKSTLLNAMMKEKIAITSEKPQTTRNNILGILNDDNFQLVFIDTPGVHKPQTTLARNMNKGVYISMQDADVIYLVVDCTKPYGAGDEFLNERIKHTKSKVFLLLNKVDVISKEGVLQLLLKWQELFDFDEIIPISALKNENLQVLLSLTLKYISEGVAYYPNDMLSDRSDSFQVKEIVREKILHLTHQEIPHGVAIVVEDFEETDTNICIQALVVVERKSQKGILIGKQADMIKKIRLLSQKELKQYFKKKVTLELYVRVEENWRNKETKLAQFGYKEYDNE